MHFSPLHHSGTLYLEAGVGRYPSVVSLVSQVLLRTSPSHSSTLSRSLPPVPPTGMDLVSSLFPLAVFTDYANTGYKPVKWIAQAQTEFDWASQQLPAYSHPITGLHYSPILSISHPELYYDTYLNAFAVHVMNRLVHANVKIPSSLLSLHVTWVAALGRGLDQLATLAKGARASAIDCDTLAFAYMAVGADFSFPTISTINTDMLSFSALQRNLQQYVQ